MKKGLLVITALLIAVVLPMSLAAQEKEIEVKVEVEGHGYGHGHGESIHAKCDIAPEIALKIQKLALELKIKNLELEKKQTEIHKEIYSAYLEEKPDGKKIKKLTKAMLAVKADLMENQHEHFMAVRKLVPAENFKMFMTRHGHGAKMGAGMHGKMGTGHQGRMGHGNMSGCTHGQGMHGNMSGCTHGQGMRGNMSGCTHGQGMRGYKSGGSHHRGAGHGDRIIKIRREIEKCDHTGIECEVTCKEIKVIKKVIKEEG
ncbi:MAG: hypothetical protein KAV42_03235 [Candidatus Krumholzibacteria bacterium]|nr:hypothetical protein [Candidatus Krumholzibacteria bacterium]